MTKISKCHKVQKCDTVTFGNVTKCHTVSNLRYKAMFTFRLDLVGTTLITRELVLWSTRKFSRFRIPEFRRRASWKTPLSQCYPVPHNLKTPLFQSHTVPPNLKTPLSHWQSHLSHILQPHPTCPICLYHLSFTNSLFSDLFLGFSLSFHFLKNAGRHPPPHPHDKSPTQLQMVQVQGLYHRLCSTRC